LIRVNALAFAAGEVVGLRLAFESRLPLRLILTSLSKPKEVKMKVENAIYPNPQRIASLVATSSSGPIAMVNLLKFRAKAEYKDGRSETITGHEAYMRYGAEMRKIVERAGGKFLFAGRVNELVIGEVEELWDAVAVVEYPSRTKFQELVMSPEMQATGVHREAGLAGQLLILTTATAF